jgi:hypothetical protein
MPATTAGGGVDVELAGGEIVEEEHRLGALHQDVVDAHRDQVDADGVVAVELEGQLELGADAVGAGHQHRLLVFLRDLEQRAEAADAASTSGRMVRLASGLMRSTRASPASISTPASAGCPHCKPVRLPSWAWRSICC